MQFLRKIFFYIFAAVYVVVCPMLILYALGYLFTPGGEEPFIKTGVIYLATNPAGAEATVNGKKQTNTTPTLVQELTGGDYSVRVNLQGYKTWEAVVPVEAEKATVLDKIILLPEKWDKREALKGPFQGLKAVPGSGYFLLFSGAAASEVSVFSMTSGTAMPLFEKTEGVQASKVTDIRTAINSTVLLAGLKTPDGEKTYWVKISEGSTSVKDITELLPSLPKNITWLSSEEEKLFYMHNGEVVRVDVDTGAVYPGYIQRVRGFGLYGGNIYVLSTGNTLYSVGYNLKGKEFLLEEKDLVVSIFAQEGTYKIEPLTNEFIAFTGEEGSLILNKLPYKFVRTGVRKLEYNDTKERLLAAGPERIAAIDFTEESSGSVAFEKGPKIEWVKQNRRSIEQAFWVYDATHVLYQERSALTLVDIESYDKFKSYPLFSVKKGTEVYYSEDTGEIYYICPDEGNLVAVELVQGSTILPDTFDNLPKEKKQNKIEAR